MKSRVRKAQLSKRRIKRNRIKPEKLRWKRYLHTILIIYNYGR